jgi:tRNA (mo5U34)-methyltransferase
MKGWAWTEAFLQGPLGDWLTRLPDQVERVWRDRPHGELPHWRETVAALPHLSLTDWDLQTAWIRAGRPEDCDPGQRRRITELLMQLHPWRKGPYEICGIPLETEWRSDWKWARLQSQIQPLQDRLVLDVGCGNGYHGWRMLGEGARLVIGIDPTQLFVLQFEAIRHFLGRQHPLHVLPLGIEALPPRLQGFDSLFSMGVFYHRRSPFEHLAELKGALRMDGELVLETLVIEGGKGQVLVPEGRYAKMRNVWFIPSTQTLEGWLRRAGFRHVRLIDCSLTSMAEQHATEWMCFESLADFLDPEDPTRTLEGYPAPRRAIFLAQA